jgi:hypothetical protein
VDHEGKTESVLHGILILRGGSVMRRHTLTRESAPHPTRVATEVRGRVLERIRRAIAEGDEALALRIARELERRFSVGQGRGAASQG